MTLLGQINGGVRVLEYCSNPAIKKSRVFHPMLREKESS
jgi:hypothetical protein